ncbi:hypothetical protein EWM64_g2171 [Hericium alpestre]|uniref:Zn(2)-C6 fungal-type domain-containing protein n=1 Tax=Hericium alpestre TaxID=135208 RepID=A0A4Z0A8C8_9AGAM|nr:hypothetical protein EWM64_g2171 [Hericium alpestre]
MTNSGVPPSLGVSKQEDSDGRDSKGGGSAKQDIKPPTKTLNRVPRACNACRKQKMRCEGAENPPCRRCKHAGLECLFEKPSREASLTGEAGLERIRSLESHVADIRHTQSVIQSSLDVIIGHLRGASAPPARSPGAFAHQFVHQSPSIQSDSPSLSTSSTARAPLMVDTAHSMLPPQQTPSSAVHPSAPTPTGQYHDPSMMAGRGQSDPHTSHMLSSGAQYNPQNFHPPMLPPGSSMDPMGPPRPQHANVSSMRHQYPDNNQVSRQQTKHLNVPGGPSSSKRSLPQSTATSANSSDVEEDDVVSKGIISEAEARELFRIFYHGCSTFLSIFDVNVDTYESLHERSPFAFDSICMVAAKVRDGGGKPSEVYTKCLQEVQAMSCATLFSPVMRHEAVQAMIIVSGWSDNGWLTGGHAVRMALELSMHKAWPRLLRRMEANKASDTPEDRELVVSARIWFCLYLFEHQMSYGSGRPAILRDDESIWQCRLLLRHPLAIEDDMRLVSTVELMAIRERVTNQLAPADAEFKHWYQTWDQAFSQKYEDAAFYRQSLQLQHLHAELFHNASALRGINGPDDVQNASPSQREVAIRSIQIARQGLDITVNSPSYREGMKYAVHYTHATATFAASFLLRLARLFPNDCDMQDTKAKIELLAALMSEIPGKRYALTLQLMLKRSKKRKGSTSARSPNLSREPYHSKGPVERPASMSVSHVVNQAPISPSYETGHGRDPAMMTHGPHQQMPQYPPQYPYMANADNIYRGFEATASEQLPVWLSDQSLGGSSFSQNGIDAFLLPNDYLPPAPQIWIMIRIYVASHSPGHLDPQNPDQPIGDSSIEMALRFKPVGQTVTSIQQERDDYFQNTASVGSGSPFHHHSTFSSSTSIDKAALRSRAAFASPGSRLVRTSAGSTEEPTAATNALDTWADPDDLRDDRVDMEIDRLFGGPESERQRTHRPKIVTAMKDLVGHRHPSQDFEHGMPALRRHSFFGQLSQEEDEEDASHARRSSVSFAPDPRNPKSTSAEGKKFDLRPKLEKLHSSLLSSKQESRRITRHNESSGTRRKFILKLAKALLSYGAPSHRIESQLFAASKILEVKASFAYLPNIVLVSFNDGDTRTTELHFVRSSGRIALTSLHKVHDVYRDVLHDDMGSAAGTEALEKILRSPPIYSLYTRCLLAFVCASVICPLAFGGSFIDMWVSGSCACVLQYLGLQAAAKSSIYANVYEISVSIIVSLIARVLSCIPGKLFCYSSISSAGVVLILPGFIICDYAFLSAQRLS